MLTARSIDGRRSPPWPRFATAGVCFALVMPGTVMDCSDRPSPVLTRVMDARRLASELQVAFTGAADAANRAVMADTDETSATFAQEAESQTQAAQTDLDLLDGIVRSLDYADEQALLAEFRDAFTKYRVIDSEILQLAVENTNLKAQRLSFGPAYEAANALRDALAPVSQASAVPAKDAWRVRALVASAVLAVREIEVLQAPHIAASADVAMADLEQQMTTLEASARSALRELASTNIPALQSPVSEASAALDRFMGVNKQLVALSRRNSNVRSLALSLGQKRKLTSVCEGGLRALNERLGQRDFTATR
jgi:hypothetical protein